MLRLHFSEAAADDLDGIWIFYCGEAGTSEADEIVAEILERLNVLTEQPRLGRERPECGDGFRALVLAQYIAFYKVNRLAIEVVRVLHGMRDIDDIFKI